MSQVHSAATFHTGMRVWRRCDAKARVSVDSFFRLIDLQQRFARRGATGCGFGDAYDDVIRDWQQLAQREDALLLYPCLIGRRRGLLVEREGDGAIVPTECSAHALEQ